MLDLIIRGGDVVTPQGVAKCDVGSQGRNHRGGRGTRHAGRRDAARVIDATRARSSCPAASIRTCTWPIRS